MIYFLKNKKEIRRKTKMGKRMEFLVVVMFWVVAEFTSCDQR